MVRLALPSFLHRTTVVRSSSVPSPNRAYEPVAQVMLVNGAMQPVAAVRSTWSQNAVKWLNLPDGSPTNYDPQSLALAYSAGVTAFIAVNARAGFAAEIPVHCIDEGERVCDGSPAQLFIEKAQRLVWLAVASKRIWGSVYFLKIYNKHGYPTDVEWVNPLDVDIDLDYARSSVRGYWVTRGMQRLYVKANPVPRLDRYGMIADYTFNPTSDIDGVSDLEVAMIRSNVEMNIAKFGAAFFANGARPDLVITTEQKMTPEQAKEARKNWDAQFKGVFNAFRAAFMGGAKYTVQTVTPNPVDLAMTELTSQADMKICAVMKVNPALVGIGTVSDPLSAKNTYIEVRRHHVDFVAVPDVRELCKALNEQWLHKDFAGGPTRWSLEPDIAAITGDSLGTGERITSAVAANQGHIWAVNEAREYTGKQPVQNIIQFNPDWAIQAWAAGGLRHNEFRMAIGQKPDAPNNAFVWEVDPRAKGAAMPGFQPPFLPQPAPTTQLPGGDSAPAAPMKQIEAPVKPTLMPTATKSARGSTSDATYVLLSLANNPDIGRVQAQLRTQYPNVEWSDPADFHLTLVYAPNANNLSVIKEVLPRSINPLTFDLGPIDTFDGSDKQPVILRVHASPALIALQAGLAGSFKALGLTLSDYSQPDAWQPHVTLGYMSADSELPTWNGKVTVTGATLKCSVESENADGFEIIYVTRSKEAETAQLHELDLWRKRVKKDGLAARFTTEFIPIDAGTWVRKSLASGTEPGLVFGGAKAWIRDGIRPVEDSPSASVEADAYDYWRAYDALQSESAALWTDYMHRVEQALDPRVHVGLNDSEVASALVTMEGDLLASWVGSVEQPGPMLKLALAGFAAGQAALDHGSAANPHKATPSRTPDKRGIEVDWSLVPADAIEFVRTYLPGLIRRVNDTTREATRKAIADWLAAGEGLDKLKERLRAIYQDPTRADAIAETESSTVYVESAVERYRRADVQEVELSRLSDGLVCETCAPLEGTVVRIGEGWNSTTGRRWPPFHPRCRHWPKPKVPGVGE